jgi:hypothetical protein
VPTVCVHCACAFICWVPALHVRLLLFRVPLRGLRLCSKVTGTVPARLAAPAWRPASPPYCQPAAPLSSSVIWNRCPHPVYPSLLRCYTTPPQDKVLGAARRLLECAPAIRLAGVDLSGASLAIDDCYELWDSGEWLPGWLAGARGLGE